MKIEPLTKHDIIDAIDVIKQSFSLSVKFSWSQAAIREFYQKDLTIEKFESMINTNHICLKCFNEEGITGVLLFSSKRKLAYLFVVPNEYGNGIATQLFTAAKLKVDKSVEYIELTSTEYAVPIYKKLGFKKSAKAFNYNGCIFQPMVYWLGNDRLKEKVEFI